MHVFSYLDEAASAAEFRRLFQDNPAMLDRVAEDPDVLPTSCQVVLTSPDDEAARDALMVELQQLPGVHLVDHVPRVRGPGR